jgi:hypothetical protein
MPRWFSEENMPITLREVGGGIGIVFDCQGVVTGQEMIQANKLLLSFGENVKKCLFGMIDQSNVTSVDFSVADLQAIAEQDKGISALARKGVVVAVVSPSNIQYGLSRMWEALVEETGWQTMVFRSKQDAEGWIKRKLREDFGIESPVEV